MSFRRRTLWNTRCTLLAAGVFVFLAHMAGAIAQTAPPAGMPELKPRPATSIWEEGVGRGFRPGTESLSLSTGVNLGVPMLGGRESHHLALASLSYGWMASRICGRDSWYRESWEIRAELFGGSEFSPEREWVVGIAPHLRYNLATGTRWMPFFDLGAGVSATSIGPPDLSGIFEFNLQAGAGTQWFLRDNLALTVEARYLHLSCARISDPNLGLNGVAALLGLTLFF